MRATDLITLMIEAVQISKTMANLYQSTQHDNPENSHLCTIRTSNHTCYFSVASFTTHQITKDLKPNRKDKLKTQIMIPSYIPAILMVIGG
jgi:hypothetical protein